MHRPTLDVSVRMFHGQIASSCGVLQNFVLKAKHFNSLMLCYGSERVNIFIFLCISTRLERYILCEKFTFLHD